MKKILFSLIIISLTACLTTCFLYDERVYDNPYDPNRNAGVFSVPYHFITIDADTSEWDEVQMADIDTIGDPTRSGSQMVTGGDLTELKIAQDDDNLYFYIAVDQGYPLQTPGLNLNFNFNENIDSEYRSNFNLLSIANNTDGELGYWANYLDVNFPRPSIRFAGFNINTNAMEIAVAKSDYWNVLPENFEADTGIDTWYEQYQNDFGDGGIDGIVNDGEDNFIIKLKDVQEELTPAADAPILDLPAGIATNINGIMDAGENWESNLWFNDITGDDTGSQDNCDIDKVYIMQDDDRVYFFLTFADLNTYSLATQYEIQIDQGGSYWHTFYVEHDGASWTVAHVDYNASQYINGTNVAGDGLGAGIEMEFEKHPAWNDLDFGSTSFRIVARDQFSSEVDKVSFYASYKKNGDPAPAIF